MPTPNPNIDVAKATHSELAANGYTVTVCRSAVGRNRKPSYRVKPTCNKAAAKRRPIQHGVEAANGPAMAG